MRLFSHSQIWTVMHGGRAQRITTTWSKSGAILARFQGGCFVSNFLRKFRRPKRLIGIPPPDSGRQLGPGAKAFQDLIGALMLLQRTYLVGRCLTLAISCALGSSFAAAQSSAKLDRPARYVRRRGSLCLLYPSGESRHLDHQLHRWRRLRRPRKLRYQQGTDLF